MQALYKSDGREMPDVTHCFVDVKQALIDKKLLCEQEEREVAVLDHAEEADDAKEAAV
jgi:hypothetical protein